MPLPSSTRLGPYEILSLIGAGGMGEVYRARDTRLNREVAIKVLGVGLANDRDRRALSDHNDARLIGDVARASWRRSLLQRQARNGGCLLLCRADEPSNPGRQFELQLMRRREDSPVTSILCHEIPIPYPQDNRKLRQSRNNGDRIRQD